MGGCGIPGPLRRTGSLAVDEGTLCRNATPAPLSLGLAPIVVNESLLTESRRALFRLVIQEGLRRGARHSDLLALRLKYLLWIGEAGKFSGGPRNGPPGFAELSAETDWANWVIEDEKGRFELIIRKEMELISSKCRTVPEQIKDTEHYQYHVRPLYYSFGYTDPTDFLAKQIAYSFLGKKETWIHEDLADILDEAPSVLNNWSPGLAARVANEVKEVSGLQIRPIAGHDNLSNHAFGVAIDVDPYSNPHIVGRAVQVFNWVVQRAGQQFDFGKFILNRDKPPENYTFEQIKQLLDRGIAASAAAREWLEDQLPRYEKIREQLLKAGKKLGLTIKSNEHLEKLYFNAEEKSSTKICKVEFESAAPALTSPDPRFVALQEFKCLLDEIQTDEHLRRIQILYEDYDKHYINTWKQVGILTMNLYLAAALSAELGLRWGETYKKSKDAMHFELMGPGDKAYIAPDFALAKGEKPRTLQKLMAEVFGRGDLKWRLALPALLQNPGHKR